MNGSDLESCSVDLSTCRIQVLGIDFIELVKSVLAKYKSSFFFIDKNKTNISPRQTEKQVQ